MQNTHQHYFTIYINFVTIIYNWLSLRSAGIKVVLPTIVPNSKLLVRKIN